VSMVNANRENDFLKKCIHKIVGFTSRITLEMSLIS
jgi:hypothetical protein